jgi:hypothetical protein
MHLPFVAFALIILLPCIDARTDLTGCTRTDTSSPAGISYAWIVPDTGELCEFLDCGGGRAPPKLNVPGCAAYTGSQTYEPSYLAEFTAAAAGGDAGAVSTATSAATSATTTLAVVTPTSTAGTDETGDGDDVDAGESANVVASTIISAAATTTSRDDVTATAVDGSDHQRSTNTRSLTETSTLTSTSQALISSSITDSTSTATTYSTTSSTTFSAVLSLTLSSGSTTAIGSLSMSRSWVKTVPTFTRAAADDGELVRAGVSKSVSASVSLVTSTGAAGRVGVVGSVGVVAFVMGVLAVM